MPKTHKKRTNAPKQGRLDKNTENISASEEDVLIVEDEEETSVEAVSETDGESANSQLPDNEIDDFTRALLNKKTEMALWPDEEPVKEPEKPVLSEKERQEAEKEMISALDQLRVERGQQPIEVEEAEYEWDQLGDVPYSDDDDDDFTTESLSELKTGLNDPMETDALQHVLDEVHEETKAKQAAQNQKKSSSSRKKKKKNHSAKTSGKSSSSQQKEEENRLFDESLLEEKPSASRKTQTSHAETAPAKKQKLTKRGIGLIVVVILALTLGLCAYAYKTLVVDPSNTITAEQQTAYDNLIAYADEYAKASDSEKEELLQLENGYNSLSDKQKKAVNDYFIKVIGQNVDDLLGSLRSSAHISDSTNQRYQTLLEFAKNFGTLDDAAKRQILDYKSTYDSLSDELKKSVDDAFKQSANSNYSDLYTQISEQAAAEQQTANNDQQTQPEDQNQAADDNCSVLLAEYQAALDSLNSDRADYALFLSEQGVSTDEVLQEYDSQIAYYQNLLNNLSCD